MRKVYVVRLKDSDCHKVFGNAKAVIAYLRWKEVRVNTTDFYNNFKIGNDWYYIGDYIIEKCGLETAFDPDPGRYVEMY